ncbi:MAG: serine--tRNA ligase, partial [Candidatus Omnitrophica bacterium]|nr:serine--tRNA ligase [Candidatus Omnitrophota bacterium]
MLDIKFIRENPQQVKDALKKRNLNLNLDQLIEIDNSRRKILLEVEELRAKQNKANDEIAALLKGKKDAKEKIASMKSISAEIDKREKELKKFDPEIDKILLTIPNIPHSSVPVGEPDKAEIVREWGKQRAFDFKPLTHIELAQHLDIVDFARGAKIAASNFILYKGWGAKLERALINFMLDLHTKKHGFTEIFPPFLVNRRSMTGTGQ